MEWSFLNWAVFCRFFQKCDEPRAKCLNGCHLKYTAKAFVKWAVNCFFSKVVEWGVQLKNKWTNFTTLPKSRSQKQTFKQQCKKPRWKSFTTKLKDERSEKLTIKQICWECQKALFKNVPFHRFRTNIVRHCTTKFVNSREPCTFKHRQKTKSKPWCPHRGKEPYKRAQEHCPQMQTESTM